LKIFLRQNTLKGLLFLIGLLSGLLSEAQVTKIMGTITDAGTKEPIPFVNVAFKGTTIGTITDFEGKYAIETRKPEDSLVVSYVGYQTMSAGIIRNKFQVVNFILEPTDLTLGEVTITYSGNPAETILRKIIERKDQNSMRDFDYYQYEVYSKIEIDANNISERLKKRRILRPFNFIFQYMDTSTINGKAYLPVFISENLSDLYYRKNPKAKKEVIKASRISGEKNESVSQLLGDLYQNVNIYGNYISLFKKNFVSPIANFGLSYYRYYLVDSAFIDHNRCYHISFKPRRPQELTFAGNFWVNDTTWAIRKIDMRIANDANLNFVNDLALQQEFVFVDRQYWMLTKDYLIIDFNVVDNARRTLGFFAHKTTSYKDFVINMPADKKIYSIPTDIFVQKNAQELPDDYWNDSRHEDLTIREKNIYAMVDSIKNIPVFKTYLDIVFMVTNGYYTLGPVEIGPYFKIFSYNDVEGARFRIGGRTSNDFSNKIMLFGHVAYGTNDKVFKYGAGVFYVPVKNPRKSVELNYKYDVEQLGLSPNAFTEDNILSSLFRRSPSNKLTMIREYKAVYEHEWFSGFSNTLHFIHREIYPIGGTEFIIYPNGTPDFGIERNNIFTSEIRFDTRFAWKEKIVRGQFLSYSLGSRYPIVEARYMYGIPNFLSSDYEYHKLTLNIQQWFNFSTIGWSKYTLETGKMWGRVPYPLLKIHEGNQTFFNDEYAYNLVDYYEFASDEYISTSFTHHFEGLLFNKIPLLRKLKWREVVHAKGVIGNISKENKNYSEFPRPLGSFGQRPYYEAGVGIENIFKVGRIDAIWRLSHRNDAGNPHTDNFGILISFQFSF